MKTGWFFSFFFFGEATLNINKQWNQINQNFLFFLLLLLLLFFILKMCSYKCCSCYSLLFTWKSVINTWKSTWSIVSHREDKWQSQKVFLPIFIVSVVVVVCFFFQFLRFSALLLYHFTCKLLQFFFHVTLWLFFLPFFISFLVILHKFLWVDKKTIWNTTSEKEIYVKLCHHLHTHTHTHIWVTSTEISAYEMSAWQFFFVWFFLFILL